MEIFESSQELKTLDLIKDQGTYVITGGLGELGMIFAHYLINKAKVRLVITGRSKLKEEKYIKLKELENYGGDILYIQADISKKEDVKNLVSKIKEKYGKIDGVVHSAGVIKDSFVLKKSKEEIDAVLSSKVFGTRYIDEVLKDEPLDFFILFSSIASVLGNVGQSDYAYANSYLDYFAQWRNDQCKAGKRFGKTLSINWPLWEDGRMSVDNEKLEIMKDSMGMIPLSKKSGILAFEHGLNQHGSQFIVVNGEKDKINTAMKPKLENEKILFDRDDNEIEMEKVSNLAALQNKELLTHTENFLKKLIAEKTNIDVKRIRNDESFGNYGIESVTIMSLTKSMEEKIGELSKTLFFEYDTTRELAHYLIETKTEALKKLFSLDTRSRIKYNHTKEQIDKKTEKRVTESITKSIQSKSISIGKQVKEVNDEIAIIGVAGRYPMAQDLDEFWENLKKRKDCVTEIPTDRWDHNMYFNPNKGTIGKTYSRWGSFIGDVDKFDAHFFNILPNEAKFIDPQERLFLETTWNAIEDAGYSSNSLKGKKIGVFVGAMYGLYQLLETEQFGDKVSGRSSFASIANRVSYFFDFHGPSMALDTMCSSSLVALHQGCDSIRKGESEMVIAGGVNLALHPNKYIQLSMGNFVSSDGKCRSFGENGDGYVPGEGVGAVILKPLKKAVDDGDQIYGIIKGSSINSGGRTSGYTVPNPNAQSELIKEVLHKAEIDPRTISYIEAHGTGTSLGDPIEITGLTKAFREFTEDHRYCPIGSVKSNIGHLESAAGIAALTKVLLQLKHKTLVPSIHSDNLNPYIDFNSTPFYVQQTLQEWKQPIVSTKDGEKSYPRRAGISAFGAGGANAHVILEEYIQEEPSLPIKDEKPILFILSAKNKDRLAIYAEKLNNFLDKYSISKKEGAITGEEAELGENSIKLLIQEEIAELLSVTQSVIADNVSFNEYDLDVYNRNILCERLQIKLGIDIPTEVLVYCNTVSSLAKYICKCHKNDRKFEPFVGSEGDAFLHDLAFTLQVGRDSMIERLAILARNINELQQGLTDYKNGKKDNPNVKYGNINDYIEKFDALLNGDVLKEQIERYQRKKDLSKLAEFWVMGADVDWNMIYENQYRKRISLPTYPFERKSYWIMPISSDNRLIPNPQEGNTSKAVYQNTNIVDETPTINRQTTTMKINMEKVAEKSIEDMMLDYLKQTFSEVLQLPVDFIRPTENFESYGIDSIHINQLNKHLEKEFGKLPSTLMFTYKNLKTLSKYFVDKEREKVHSLLNSMDNYEEVGVNQETTINFSEPVENKETTFENERDIAIIGLSGKFPKVEDMDEFIYNLMQGKDNITEIPKERWDYKQYPDITCKWGGFVEDADKFDPQFFSISPRNAAFMDPQERLFLQAVWSCLEDSGYTPESLGDPNDEEYRGNVAVYAGVSFNSYGLYGAADMERGISVPLNSQIYSVANRVSYLLNLKGPSLSVDTACSSSLYAIHLGCESILREECDMAIAGGVNLTLHPSKYITLDSAKFLASDGHCRSFGEGGDGYVPGEGVGAVLLKPLWKAKRDQDHIYGVIKGSEVNHDGKTNGFSVPNPVAQKEVIKKALKKAKIDPRTISYVEAHGTGTSLGDPIEITALTEAYRAYTTEKQYCSIGSVKSNIGHLEAAAGISQVAKVLMQMKHKVLVPNRLNSKQINSNIDFSETPFRVQSELEEWKKPQIGQKVYPRRSGLSSFGVGGVNVHMIIEEYEPEREYSKSKNQNLLIIPLSAKNENVLLRYVTKFYTYLQSRMNQEGKVESFHYELPDIRDMAFTLQLGRVAHPYRVVFVASEYHELMQLMELYVNKKGDLNDSIQGIIKAKAISARDKVKLGINAIPKSSDIYELGNQWVQGYDVRFNELYKDYFPNRVSLPVYPFEKERYWMYNSSSYEERNDASSTIRIQEKNTNSSTNNIITESSQSNNVVINTVENLIKGSKSKSSPVSENAENILKEPVDNESSYSSRDREFLYLLADAFEGEQIPILISYIQDIFASLLGFTEGRLPDPEQGFFELGLESVAIAEGYNLLQTRFDLELDDQIFFNYPNIKELAEHLLSLLDLENIEPLVKEEAAASMETEKIDENVSKHLSIEEMNENAFDDVIMNKLDDMSENELIAMLEKEIANE
ncbi:SDR family NAD(P)-dependent oxidoreductase [Niallia sp. HCP3S3_B10]|uniref:SDR family NAD(P)-dependent oxidoreductase n=1 Tax=Niallia sp. HCP3S3_B10 TaxID=3438944 RepID=UPI003F8C8702